MKKNSLCIKDYFNFCSSIADKPHGGPLVGLCLICLNTKSTITICGTECDKIATGVCGTKTVF